MAIHDGVVWSRAAAKAVARGNCLGGTFGGNCLENDECMTKLECPIRDIPVIRGSSVIERFS